MKQKRFFQCSLCEEIFELHLSPREIDQKRICEDLNCGGVCVDVTFVPSDKKPRKEKIAVY